jgi:hypothetical protein
VHGVAGGSFQCQAAAPPLPLAGGSRKCKAAAAPPLRRRCAADAVPITLSPLSAGFPTAPGQHDTLPAYSQETAQAHRARLLHLRCVEVLDGCMRPCAHSPMR